MTKTIDGKAIARRIRSRAAEEIAAAYGTGPAAIGGLRRKAPGSS